MGKRGTLTEKAETRISKTTARRLTAAARRFDRSESAIQRRAIELYLNQLEQADPHPLQEEVA